MVDLKDREKTQRAVATVKKTARPPLYNVFLEVSGRLTPGDSLNSVELPEQCAEALEKIFEKTDFEAIGHICEALTTGKSLVGVFMWETADDKAFAGNAIMAGNNFDPPFNKPVEFRIQKN